MMPTFSAPSPAAFCGLPHAAASRTRARAARRNVADPLIGRLSLPRCFAWAHARSATGTEPRVRKPSGDRSAWGIDTCAGFALRDGVARLHSGRPQCGPPIHGFGCVLRHSVGAIVGGRSFMKLKIWSVALAALLVALVVTP